jgi:predicted RNA-binding Zn-ribbon protein involved in translation (DUF1610 family)
MPTPPAMPAQAPSTVHYACFSCGAGMVWSGRVGGLLCPSCGSTKPIERDPNKPAERDLEAALSAPPPAVSGPSSPDKELVCPNCNGAIGLVDTLTATRCPFCATPVQRSDVRDAPNRQPVDGVVPFGIDQQQAKELVEGWISQRWFAPNAFKKYSSTGSFNPVYLPFFTFDAQTLSDYAGERGITHTRTVGSGQNQHTETYTVWHYVEGTVDLPFDDVAVGASTSLDPERMSKLEPWPTRDAVTFRGEYLAGAVSRSYDLDLPQCYGHARQRMETEIAGAVRSDIGGDQQRIHQINTSWRDQTFRHLLLPLFLLVVTFHQKPFQVYVNGVTGEVHGQRPYSWVKITLAVLAALIVAGVAIGIYASHRNSGGQ